ncbi:NAD-glutamate dehydrogenase [Cryptosporangium phraense]|uniref:NAD-glutamate dehydrogenase n=1 Tax=Cryptosporangium phraense TaxID=2593070 RepID=A0A545AS62_9ACTN|nr:NAD-glutamate dehydrogenase [Cryptosporangium phraense]TQS44177.1 NAD-glutamate dehydrogenase [Cryptosporangium phraense]
MERRALSARQTEDSGSEFVVDPQLGLAPGADLLASVDEVEAHKDALIAKSAATTDDPLVAALLPVYYRYVAAEELLNRSPADLVAATVSHRELGAVRARGELKLRVRTPSGDAGWCGGHTVIELVTDDMPFLVDSVTAELARHELGVHLLVHPQMVVVRDDEGTLTEVRPVGDPDAPVAGEVVESWMHIEIDRRSHRGAEEQLQTDLARVLDDVRAAVTDWDEMRARALTIADGLTHKALPVPDKDVTDARELLRWLADDHFTFLGYREYSLEGDDRALVAVPGTGLGILREGASRPRRLADMPEEVRANVLAKRLLIITKANSRSTVHRPAYLDYVGFKTFDADGNVTGERRFLGLFSSAAYLDSVRALPVISRKVDEVLARSGLSRSSHSGKDLLQILETYPRDELFQIATSELFETTMAVLRLGGRRRLRLFVRRDAYGRFISCVVYLPRDRYTTQNRLRMQDILMDALHGVGVDYTTRVTESVLARVKFVVRTDPNTSVGPIDVDQLQQRLADATRSWDDEFATEIRREIGEEQATRLLRRYGTAFNAAYQAEHTPAEAVEDLSRIEVLEEEGDLGVSLYRSADRGLRFTVYRLGDAMALSDVLPVLHSLGVEVVDERPYRVQRTDDKPTWVYDFGLRVRSGTDVPHMIGRAIAESGPLAPPVPVDIRRVHSAMENAFAACWRGECEVDGFNALVVSAGLAWDEVVVLRAYAKYLRQAGSRWSQEYVERVLAENPQIARMLVDLFTARFDPNFRGDADARAAAGDALLVSLTEALDAVQSLDADRILRSVLTLITATLRTNHFQRGRAGRHKPYLSFKIDPRAVPDLPAPRPKFEIFVYSPRVEGVHLRFGAVARGGLRWSDRREDFRTEILGLVKAQMVKNTVIVPVGSKGGFVVKNPPVGGDRDAIQAEGIACYRTFISGLLDLTDNLDSDGRTVLPPVDVVRHDGDDSYLVVAADKGTATFSDIANEVAAEYGFWLGDAFASGGSVGYDHKAMGITARGAWESVKRHFRELGHDTQTQDFTVVGVGDMSGDVFGNGMLLSEHIRLVAAFDHRHIFVDPNPDAAVGFAERRRLFDLPRSSWEDYDKQKISAGGGVFPRTAKAVDVTPEMRAALGLPETATRLSPAELMRAILLAPVDLLWNGGIGTYVKASDETQADAGDKSNDAVRVNGKQLRARVVGEGGNLGLTQRGRIEYALEGGRVNTDAIDNSAGVDTSDHEVNIKILLNQAVHADELDTEARNALLAEMTDEVAHLVLADNYAQNEALSLARHLAPRLLGVHRRLMSELERAGRLDRALEFLPDDETAATRESLTSPELSVLLAYVKIGLADDVLAGPVPDDPWCRPILRDYFPTPLRERYARYAETHPLRREIITTAVVNEVVNHGGVSFVFRAVEETGATPADIVRAYAVIRDVCGLGDLWRAANELDSSVPASAQQAVMVQARRVLDRGVRWLLQSRSGSLDVEAEIARLRPGMTELMAEMGSLMLGREADRYQGFVRGLEAEGVPADLADRVTAALYGFGLLDVVELSHHTELSGRDVATLYYTLSERFRVDEMLDRISALPRADRWQALARLALRYDLYSALDSLTREVLRRVPGRMTAEERVSRWADANADTISRALTTLALLAEDAPSDLATLTVVLRQIRTVVRASSAHT